jgi:peptidyl-prolyl cis-trans isomerase C
LKKEENMKISFLKVIAVIVLMLVWIPTAVKAQDKEILAKIGTKVITAADLNRVIGYYEPEQQNMIEKNPQIKENILWQIVRSTVIANLAKKKGFDRKPEIRSQQEMIVNNFLATVYLQKEVVEKITISEEKTRAYYKDHSETFKTVEMIKVKHILIKIDSTASEDEKKKRKAKAEEVLKKLKEDGDFSKLAAEFSDDPGTKDKGGDLDFFPKGTMVPAFEEAAFALKPGEISGIVETEYGFHILKMEEKKEAHLEPYEQIKDKVKDQALQEMRRAAVTEFIEKTLKNAGAVVNPEPLSKPKK